jgi:4-aminobutyrate aminotransferase-like enzyme
MWGYQRHDVVPDIVSMGKPMGNGYPVAGIAVRPEVASKFGHDMRYFNTSGGNTVAMAAANSTLEVLQDENLIANSRVVGKMMLSSLNDIMHGDERIGDVRGSGLYMGIEIVKDRETREPDSPLALALVNELRRRRVLVSATAANANVLKVRPPLTFSAQNADRFLTELKGALETVHL